MNDSLHDRVQKALAWQPTIITGEDLISGRAGAWVTEAPDFRGLLAELFADADILRGFYNVAIAERNAAWTKLDRLERVYPKPYQDRVQDWCVACFGPTIAADVVERNHRFLEEALELVQSLGCTQDEANQLVEYVFSRPAGEPAQELGGVMVTLAALAVPNGLDVEKAAETELARVWTKVEAIRAKQAAKPQFGPLPGPTQVEGLA